MPWQAVDREVAQVSGAPTGERPDPSPDRDLLRGRQATFTEMMRLLGAALNGTGHILTLRGEAGVGKSRLVAELCDEARRRGARVLFGRAEEFESGMPYAAVRSVLASVAPHEDGERALLDRVAELVSGRVAAPDQPEPVSRLAAVYAAMTDLVVSECARGPVVLVMEDTHVADQDSVALLQVLARTASSAGCLLVLTMRPDHTAGGDDLESAVERLGAGDEATILDLDALPGAAVAEIISDAHGVSPTPELLAAVMGQSRGNPFFVKETMLALGHSGLLVTNETHVALARPGVPSLGRRTAILHRVFQGHRSAREVAKVLAIIGRTDPSRLALVVALTGLPEAEVERTFDGLISDSILQQSTAGRYEFAHPLVRSALHDDIGPAERQRLHRAAAEWLLRQDDPLSRLEATTHIAESAIVGDVEAAAVLVESGDSQVLVAPLASAAWYERALEVLSTDSSSAPTIRARQARALWLGSRPLPAAHAGQLAIPRLEPEQRDRTIQLVINALYAAGRTEEALHLADRLLARGQGGLALSAQRAHIALQAGWAHSDTVPEPDVVATGRELPVVLSHLLLRADMAADPDRALLVDRCIATLPELPLGSRLALLEVLAMVHADAGELSEASRCMAEASALADGISASNLGGQLASAVVRYQWLSADWEAASETAIAAERDLDRSELRGNLSIVQILRARILVDTGHFDAATALLGKVDPPVPSFRILMASVAARRERLLGNPASALELIGPVVEEAAVQRWRQWLHHAVAEAVESALALDAPDLAEHHLALLGDEDPRPLHMVTRLRLAGRLRGDREMVRQSTKVAAENRLVFEEAVSILEEARGGGVPEERTTVAMGVFESVGADPWTFQLRQVLREQGLALPRSSAQHRGGLTNTEMKMAELVQRGLTNREIAAALHYSPKTVEVYLSRVYAKLGVSTRFALARVMDSGDLKPVEP